MALARRSPMQCNASGTYSGPAAFRLDKASIFSDCELPQVRMVKQKFEPGALVFGKVKGYPPWPARVTALTSKDRYGENDF